MMIIPLCFALKFALFMYYWPVLWFLKNWVKRNSFYRFIYLMITTILSLMMLSPFSIFIFDFGDLAFGLNLVLVVTVVVIVALFSYFYFLCLLLLMNFRNYQNVN